MYVLRTRCLTLCLCILLICTSTTVFARWVKPDEQPDVDKSSGEIMTCWLATAANMLAGAGYGSGANAQTRAEEIYDELILEYGVLE